MTSDDLVQLTKAALSADAALRAVGFTNGEDGLHGDDAEAGALVLFSGHVRAREGSATVEHLDYESYDAMAKKEIRKLVEQARMRWPLRRVAVLHRTGPIPVGDASVIVAVAAGHRAEAFDAARFLIDELKRSVPIWKNSPAKS